MGAVGGDGGMEGGFDEVVRVEDAKGVPKIVMGVTGGVRERNEEDRVVVDEHTQDMEVTFEHV